MFYWHDFLDRRSGASSFSAGYRRTRVYGKVPGLERIGALADTNAV